MNVNILKSSLDKYYESYLRSKKEMEGPLENFNKIKITSQELKNYHKDLTKNYNYYNKIKNSNSNETNMNKRKYNNLVKNIVDWVNPEVNLNYYKKKYEFVKDKLTDYNTSINNNIKPLLSFSIFDNNVNKKLYINQLKWLRKHQEMGNDWPLEMYKIIETKEKLVKYEKNKKEGTINNNNNFKIKDLDLFVKNNNRNHNMIKNANSALSDYLLKDKKRNTIKSFCKSILGNRAKFKIPRPNFIESNVKSSSSILTMNSYNYQDCKRSFEEIKRDLENKKNGKNKPKLKQFKPGMSGGTISKKKPVTKKQVKKEIPKKKPVTKKQVKKEIPKKKPSSKKPERKKF